MKNCITFLHLFHMKFRETSSMHVSLILYEWTTHVISNTVNSEIFASILLYIIYWYSSSVSYRPLLDYIIILRTVIPYFTY